MATRTEPDRPRGPVTLTDYVTAIRAEANGRLNDRQLDALAEHLYGVAWVSELDLEGARRFLAYLEGWRRAEQAERAHRKVAKELARKEGWA